MKQCLLIAYYFPPRDGIGSQRPSKLAKYLSQFGWNPIVLTAKLPGKPSNRPRVIETDYEDILASAKSLFGLNPAKSAHEQLNVRIPKDLADATWKSRAIKMTRDFIAYPDEQKGWHKHALRAACELLDKEKVDIIISTSSPVTSHIIAGTLKKEYQIPWVADLRDLWSQNHFNDKCGFIRFFERRCELKTLALADSLVTVSPGFAANLRLMHRNKRVDCITNGFDTDDFGVDQKKLTDKFTITYTGLLYQGRRDPSLLFEALSMLIEEGKIDKKLLEVRFYGPHEEWLLTDARKYKLDDIVASYGTVSREMTLQKQKESQLLLLVLDKKGDEKDVYPAKMFEYFGARRPIIAFGGPVAAVRNLLNKTDAGEFATDKNVLKNIVYGHYRQFVSLGAVKWSGNDDVEDYVYRNIARKYSERLDEIVKR